MAILWVALGGAIGAAGRYAIGLIPWDIDFPIKTLIVNILGSFLIGLFVGAFNRFDVPKNIRLFLQSGICGGFTTFSTFSLENIELFEKGRYAEAVGYMGISLICCVFGVWLGKQIFKCTN